MAGQPSPSHSAAPRASAPATKTARQSQIVGILSREQVHSQEQLAGLLAQYAGLHVAQATLSRDLDELGVVRLRASSGTLVYALPGDPGGPGSRPGTGLDPSHHPERPEATAPPSAPDVTRAGPEASAPASPDSTRPQDAGATPGPPGATPGPPGGPTPGATTGGSASTRLLRYLRELLTSAEASANLVVLRTPAGAAQFLASAIDHAVWPAILGTVAGDDTVLVISRDPTGGEALAAEFRRLAEGRR